MSGGGNTQPKNRIAADYDDTGPKKTQLQTSGKHSWSVDMCRPSMYG